MNTPDGHASLADGVASAWHWGKPGTSVTAYDENEKYDGLGPPWDTLDPEGR